MKQWYDYGCKCKDVDSWKLIEEDIEMDDGVYEVSFWTCNDCFVMTTYPEFKKLKEKQPK